MTTNSVTVETDVPAPMRDGVVLRANVFRPLGGEGLPTLLARTPYDKDDAGQALWSGLDPVAAARQGFLVAVQDVRGRFASDGEWSPFEHEREDGYDSVEWAARLPGSNGRVGMYSASYCGNAQWLAAGEGPPGLGAIAPGFTWADPGDGLFARGGAVELGLELRWALENGFDFLARTVADPAARQERIEAVVEDWDRLGEHVYWQLPIEEIAALRRHPLPGLGAIRALSDPRIAELAAVGDSYRQVSVPSFHTAGWYDIFSQGTLDNYQAMRSLGRDARLVVGPWTHHAFEDPIGELLFGMQAARGGAPGEAGLDWGRLQLEWFGEALTGRPAASQLAPVSIFVMGRNEWRQESEWPLARARTEHWFLRAGGSLRPEGPDPGEAATEFGYDPADPVPTRGGQGVMSVGYPSGPIDQSPIEARSDVLVFTSEPLQVPLEVTGPVSVQLHVESSAPSTDWVARLCDVHPDGRSINLCDGIHRVAAVPPGPAPLEIELWSTSNVFLPGHRLRVHVTSSSFPRWDRNLNTGNQRRSQFGVARQRLHHSAAAPSLIRLPVVAG